MELYERMAIPAACKVDKTVFKKLFYENADLSAADRALFTDGIEKITWMYCLKPETVNIPAFKNEERDYPEIEVLEVALTVDKGLRRIAEIVMRTIPYPMLLVFRLSDAYALWTAHQHINLADSSKIAVDEFVKTGWLDAEADLPDAMNIKAMHWSNYYTLYSDMVDAISVWNAGRLTGETESDLNGTEARLLLAAVEDVDRQIAAVRAELKKELQFSRKMELNMQVKKLEQRKRQMIGGQEG